MMALKAINEVTCDVDGTTTAILTTPDTLPDGWLNLATLRYGANGSFNSSSVDACPTCAAQLSDLPTAWQALLPATPT
jgi:hypothetical protein